MEMLQAANPSLRMLDQYAPVLSQKFSGNYLILYGHALCQAMHEARERKEFQKLADYLNTIEKLGGNAAAREIVSDWMEAYSGRRVMLDELGRAGW